MSRIQRKLKQIGRTAGETGISGVAAQLRQTLLDRKESRKYQSWIQTNAITDENRRCFREKIAAFQALPKISVVMPVYDVEEKWLRLCIESVIRQVYENWEFCIADDCSPSPHVKEILNEYAVKDRRIKVEFRSENGHISAASNSALRLATGEFCVLLDHDDELSEDALFWVANEINTYPKARMIYSDEDVIDINGRRSEPKFKPDLSRDLLYSLNMVTHLSAYKTDLLRELGGFRLGFEGSQDYDLALRVVERTPDDQIRHIPRVLYHWRSLPTSVAGNTGAKPYAFEKAREAIASHFERVGADVEVVKAADDLNCVRYRMPKLVPRVSVIVDGGTSADLAHETDYPSFEIVNTDRSLDIAERLNAAAVTSSGEVLCFLHGSLRPLSPAWLSEMISLTTQPDIGAVGAKLLDPDGSIDQVGFILGSKNLLRRAHHGFPRNHQGNFSRAALIGNYTAVSWQCMAVRRDVFGQISGFDAENLTKSFFDVDLCLRLWENGFRVVYTPYAELMWQKRIAVTMPDETEKNHFEKKWRDQIERDRFHNPNFTSDGTPFRLNI